MTAGCSPIALRIYWVGLADSVGLGMYLALAALFLNQAVGLPSSDVGWVLGVSGIGSLFGAIPIARAAQACGLRKGLTILFMARALAFLMLAFANSFVLALLAAAVTGLMSRGTAPLIESLLIAGGDNASAVRALARLRMVRNAGIAAGGLPAGLAVWLATPFAYQAVIGASALFFLAAATACWTLPDQSMSQSRRQGPSMNVLQNRPFIALTAMFGALSLSAILVGVGLPLWVVNKSDAPSWIVGIIQLINTILVVVLQGWASRGSEVLSHALSHMRRGGLLAAGSSALVVLSGVGGMFGDIALVLAVVIGFTLAELFIVAGGEGAALAHIPEGERPTYLAAFNLGFACATIIGPPLVAATASGPAWGWVAWSVFFALLAAVMQWLPGPRSSSSLPVEGAMASKV